MKTVLPLISSRAKNYEQHPFIQFLQDSTLTAQERLSFAPYAAHFVFAFSDFNRALLRAEGAKSDWVQQVMNTHAAEDAKHHKWYLQDLRTLGYDPSCTFTDALRFLWSEAGQQGRALGYAIISAVRGADTNLKLVAMETLETMGRVTFEAILMAAKDHPAGERLVFFGPHHVEREAQHAASNDHKKLLQVELSEVTREQALGVINEFYDRMEAFNTELLRLVEAAPKAPGDAFLRANREGLSAASSRGSEARPA